MAAVNALSAVERRSSPPPSASQPGQKPTSGAATLAELLRGADHFSSHACTTTTATPCPLFPTESEDYYCLSCYTRCSGLALLVGPHTSHDYLPLKDALLYMPAVLLREAQEVVRESEESFAKPWRVQDQQREDTLAYLLHQRQSKVAAMTRLLEEIRHVDQQLLHATEAKALDLSNWRYQQRALRRKMEKLKCGADTLSTSLGTDGAAPSSSSLSAPSWRHSQEVAQKELAQVRSLIAQQLRQLEVDEDAAHRQLETWHRLLDTTVAKKAMVQRPSAAELRNPWEQTVPFTDATNSPSQQTLSPQADPPTFLTPHDTNTGTLVDQPSTHPSNAEVVLLQHALHSIDDGLRHRLLRAAAASLTSSLSSSPSGSRDGMCDSHTPYTPVVATDAAMSQTINSSLPPLPEETPLRESTTKTSPYFSFIVHGRKGVAEGEDHTQSTAAATFGMVDTPADDVDARHPQPQPPQQQQQQQTRRQSWRAQEQALKESLNQLLQTTTAAVAAAAPTGSDIRNVLSSSISLFEKSGGDYGSVSAMSGPVSGISVLQRDPLDY